MTAIGEVYELAREATAHKRMSQSHRRIAVRKFEELRRLCEHLGLDFKEVRSTATEDGNVHGRSEPTD